MNRQTETKTSREGTAMDHQGFNPDYLRRETKKKFCFLGEILFTVFRALLKVSINIVLKPRIGQVGNLNQDEVEKVYKQEAGNYNSMHHLTTRGQDLIWRRQAGFFVLNYIKQNSQEKKKILDICTGTGLTIKEECRILDLWQIVSSQYEIIGLDYSLDMLVEARKNSFGDNCKPRFVRGDATKLTEKKDGFDIFAYNSIDLVTQMFGIGGIDKPQKVLKEVLKVLKPGGQYFLLDMHKPIEKLPGEWFFLGKWLQLPTFETRVYEEVTIPLVLKRKWAWRDTTSLFYEIRMITFFDEGLDEYYGFKVLSFEYEAQHWWLSLPIMPVARIIVEKVVISKEEAETRNFLCKQIA